MTTRGPRNRSGARIEDNRLGDFKNGFAGDVILPADAEYGVAREIWNASIDRYPGIIARCRGVADVARAVNFARTNDILVAVRGGGHNVGGRALCDDGIVIDLSAMRGVYVDPDQRTVRVQGVPRSGMSTARPMCTGWPCRPAWCRRPVSPA